MPSTVEPAGHDRERQAGGDGPGTRYGWARSWLLGLLILVIYLGNRRHTIGSYDTASNEVLPYMILRGDGPYLDRFRTTWLVPGGVLRDFVTSSRGHLVSRYPIASALIAVPLTWPQMWYLDRFEPGWDHGHLQEAVYYYARMSKNAMAVVAALVGVLLVQVLDRLGLRRVALPTALAATLGSDLWAVASQAAWAHGPAALALIAMIRLLLPGPRVSRLRLTLAGLTAGVLVAIRLIDVVFMAAVALWLLRARPKGLGGFLLAAAPVVLALLAYNVWYFDTWEGGQAQLEALHLTLHRVRGVWTGHLGEGAAGTFLSPARGLFVFVPWAALALLCLPATARRIRAFPVVAWMLGALVPYALMLSKYSVWWAGHTFGPRYWTEAAVLLAIPLGFALDWSWSRCRPLLVPFAAAVLWSIALQAIGAFCYPSTWNMAPANVDLHHERLWDWRDSEVVRCLREGRKPW